MGFKYGAFLLLVIASTLAIAQARTIVVGGSENWHPGFNYTDWALKNSPFFIHDRLVFKYKQPHNVYRLPYLYNYLKCDFRGAHLLAGPTNGAGNGFEVVLSEYRLYYFASSSGHDCSDGLMKFFVMPLPRWK